MKTMSTILLAVLLTAGASAQVNRLLPLDPMMGFQAAGDRESELYRQGADALNAEQWQTAIARFDEVAKLRGQRAEGALYWKAFALHKAGRPAEARASIAELRRSYPQSRWLKEASALEIEMGAQSGQPVRPESQSDEELKLLALNALMNRDDDEAVALLEKFLRGNQSAKLKERALFVLSQSSSPKGRQLMGQIARGQSHPDLQMKALHYLGIEGSKENLQTLSEIYASSNNQEVKRAILRSFGIAGDSQRLLNAARQEKDPKLVGDAIHGLGISGGTAELAQLYGETQSAESKARILHSLGVAGDRQRLLNLARQEKDPKLVEKAVHGLGIAGGSAELRQLYQETQSAEVKADILHGLMIAGDEQFLADIARKETNPDLKAKAIHQVGIAGGKQAGPALLAIYQGTNDRNVKEAVVQALFVSDNAAILVDLAKNEKDAQMRRAIVGKLAHMDDPVARKYMLTILEE